MGGRGAANEVISEGLAGDVLANMQLFRRHIIGEAWTRISTNGAVAYGNEMISKTWRKVRETLLIGADLVREEKWGPW